MHLELTGKLSAGTFRVNKPALVATSRLTTTNQDGSDCRQGILCLALIQFTGVREKGERDEN
jgi:hypothetical protein